MSGGTERWSARGYILAGLFFTLLLAGVLGTWSATAKLAGAVISSGQLRVEAQKQVVQHIDGGVVGEILVREGDVVDAGDVLIRLDGTRLQAELAVIESQLFEIMARRGRLEAEQAGFEAIRFDPELLRIARERPEVQDLIEGQRALFEARIETMSRELEVLGERQAQLREQITGSEGEAASYDRQRELIEEELEGQRRLLAQGLAQASRVLALEREGARLIGEGGMMRAQTAQLKAQIAELEIERVRLAAARREEAISQLRDIGFRELELRERRISVQDQLSRLDIRAPRSGVVYEMKVFALQSVVRPADPILYIVPSDELLVIDAKVDPIHIDQIFGGQDAVLRFSAFNQRTTPELFGKVVRISPDALYDEQLGVSYYEAEVLLNEGELERLDNTQLMPGMPVEVFIQTDARTPLNYLMKPLTDYFNRALREE